MIQINRVQRMTSLTQYMALFVLAIVAHSILRVQTQAFCHTSPRWLSAHLKIMKSGSDPSQWALYMGKPPPNPPQSKEIIPADKKLPKIAPPLVPEFSRKIQAHQVPAR